MKIHLFILAFFTFLNFWVTTAQTCLPGEITFSTQTEVDNFPTNYPGCSQILGNVRIIGEGITNLNGLSVLTSIGGDLRIQDNQDLTSLTGLNALTFIGGTFAISGNGALVSIIGINSLNIIKEDFYIVNNFALKSITGLNALTSIGRNFPISSNVVLTSITGFNSLTSIGRTCILGSNIALTSITGFNSLTSIGGLLWINSNSFLTSLSGLNKVTSIGNLEIRDNNLLSLCHIRSICDYLSIPSNPAFISGNAIGCNSRAEIKTACVSCLAVSIATQPSKQQALPGSTATFNVEAAGTPPYTYQWRKNEVNIPNAINTTYTTPPVTLTDNGNLYSCVIKNCNGTNSITSNNALLTVCARPTQQASIIKFSPTCVNPIIVSWNNGNGMRRVVKINTNNNFTSPLNGTDPIANPVYSGSGEQVIYNGTSNSVNLTINRSNNISFWIRVYEASCDGTFSYYNASQSTGNPINIKTEELLKLFMYETPACLNKQNGTATVEVFGGKGKQYSYLWSNTPPSRTKTAINLAQGVYSVTVSSATGCIAVGMTTVPSNPEIKVTAKVSTNINPPFTVQLTATGGIPGYVYRIGTSSGNYTTKYQNFPFFDNLTEGIYFFEVKDANGCTVEISESVGKKGDCPYPIIFLHGFSGDETTWDAVYENTTFKHIWGKLTDTFQSVNNAYNYTYINGEDGSLGTNDDDVLLKFNNENNSLKSGCLYTVNMKNWWNEDPDNPQIIIDGENDDNSQSESNESAILKSGYVIKNAIKAVLDANPGKEKVILFAHSMGGLGAREYLQRTKEDGKHRWWLYTDDVDGHRVAKVFTVSTPHRGSNTAGEGGEDLKDNGTAKGILPATNSFVPDVKSEAVRDLRYSYKLVEPNINYRGLYLYGGNESIIFNDNLEGGGFHNHDVDCNGDESSEYVDGINQKGVTNDWDGSTDNISMPLPPNVKYTYYVGNLSHGLICKYPTYGCKGDGVVDDERQWLYINGNGTTADFVDGISKPWPSDGVDYRISDRFTSEKNVAHTHLPPSDKNLPFAVIDDIDFLVRGIDEGDFPKFAYEIKENVKYAGMTQIRPEKIPVGSEYTNMGNRNIDGDWYKIVLPNSNSNNNKKKIQIQLNPNILTSGRIDFYQNTPLDFSNSNAPPNYFKTFGINQTNLIYNTTSDLPPGTYYFRITHNLNDISNENTRRDAWQKPYTFTVTFLNKFNEDLESRAKNDGLIFGSVYPNPFISSFNLDVYNPIDKEIIVEINLSNSLNQTVFEKSQIIPKGQNALSFPSTILSPGVYFLTLTAGEVKKTLKVIKIYSN